MFTRNLVVGGVQLDLVDLPAGMIDAPGCGTVPANTLEHMAAVAAAAATGTPCPSIIHERVDVADWLDRGLEHPANNPANNPADHLLDHGRCSAPA